MAQGFHRYGDLAGSWFLRSVLDYDAHRLAVPQQAQPASMLEE
jgi:hypothetical protein